MSSQDRFYLLKFQDRPVLWGDIGSTIRMQGIVVGGARAQAILLLPGMNLGRPLVVTLTDEEWVDFIHRSDDPEVLVGHAKTFQRKLRWEISGAIQQKVWAADGCKCMYCGKVIGNVRLTVDHYVPLELGGANDPSNYLTACAACNKNKGNMDPEDWCRHARTTGSHEWYKQYLEKRQLP